MKEFMSWLNEGWGFLIAIIAGVTLLWNFRKTVKDMLKEFKTPFTELDEKIVKINTRLDEIIGHDAKVDRALLTLQRNSLLKICGDVLKRGYSTPAEKSTISDQYTSYSELGGDSFISDMVTEVFRQPDSEDVLNNTKISKRRSKK